MTESIRRAAVAAGLLACLALGSFFVARALGEDALAPGTDREAMEAILADSQKPQFRGTVAGVDLRPSVEPGPDVGCPELFEHPPFETTRGTPFEIEPAYLPRGIAGENQSPSATACQGQLVGSRRSWAPAAAGGPWITIQRVVRPEPWSSSWAPADRISTGSIGGRAVVLIQPVLPDGRGGSFIIFAEKIPTGWLITQIEGEAVTMDELKRVAEGILR